LIDLECMPVFVKANRKKSQYEKRKYKQSICKYLIFILITFVLALNCRPSYAAELSLSWNSSSGATGYKVYYGFESRNYPFVVDLGLWTQCTISDLDLGQVYYFAVTAYNEYSESDFSAEIAHRPKPCEADIDVDGDIDGTDLADIIADPSATQLSDLAARFGTESCDN